MENFDIEYRLASGGGHLHASSTNDDLEVSFSGDNHRFIAKIKAKKDIILARGKLSGIRKMYKDDVFPTNGFQSWTDTRELTLRDHEKNVLKLPSPLVKAFAFDRYGDAIFYPYKPHTLHGYDLFYVKGEDELFSFNYNHLTAYLVYEIDTKAKVLNLLSDVFGLRLSPGEEITLYDVYFSSDYAEGLKTFRAAFTPREAKKLFGYTSWYNYYQDINEEIILRDLDALDSRFELFQIDDGYETFVGDWLDVDRKKFPHGLHPIVEKIHSKGYKAGIWLAPFVAETKSKVYQEHPDWIKKDEKGEPAKAGSNWSGFYCLDLSKQEVLNYIRECLETYMEMGFDFFKLDFLYAVTIAPIEGKSRAQMSQFAYSFLREVLKDKLILGCGANIFSSHGNFDYLRIGPDVSLSFDDVWYMKFMHRERISTKVTLQNTVFRSIFDGVLFHNDPDVFLLRKENIKLSDAQKEALLTINALFGSLLMTSDDIATYDAPTKAMLEEKLRLFHEASEIHFTKKGKFIHIFYTLDRRRHRLVYNTVKGTLQHD